MSTPKMIVRFAEAPAVGHTEVVEGQAFTIVAVEPHRRHDGAPTSLVTWETKCADCGTVVRFQCGQGLTVKRKRCDVHKWQFGRSPPDLANNTPIDELRKRWKAGEYAGASAEIMRANIRFSGKADGGNASLPTQVQPSNDRDGTHG